MSEMDFEAIERACFKEGFVMYAETIHTLRAEVAALKARLAGREIVIDAALHYMVPIDTIAAEETDDLMARLREVELESLTKED